MARAEFSSSQETKTREQETNVAKTIALANDMFIINQGFRTSPFRTNNSSKNKLKTLREFWNLRRSILFRKSIRKLNMMDFETKIQNLTTAQFNSA